jgi:hypothetical protein
MPHHAVGAWHTEVTGIEELLDLHYACLPGMTDSEQT